MPNPSTEAVNHPAHYGGADNPYEHIKVSRAWSLNYELGNATKYICRAGKKNDAIEDLKKAAWYIHAEIQRRDPTYTMPEEFKKYVHEILTSWGIPVDPPVDQSAGDTVGCRIGRRLRWLREHALANVPGAGCARCGRQVDARLGHDCPVTGEKVTASPCG